MKNSIEKVLVLKVLIALFALTSCSKSIEGEDNGNSGNGGSNNTTFPIGAVNGLFSVDSVHQVYFSQGNLQFQASTDTWRFAEKQWDYVGTQISENPCGTVIDSDNSMISSNYHGWIDLFGYGTSGWDCGNVYYHPWDSRWTGWGSAGNDDLYGPSSSLTGQYVNSDWGVYNAIENGGNLPGLWRTLTFEEWFYVLSGRRLDTASGILYAMARIILNDTDYVNGFVLFPDDWRASTFTINDPNNFGSRFSSNVINIEQWNSLENLGVVFLPAAGCRRGTSVVESGDIGYYRSASLYFGSLISYNWHDLYTGDDCYFGVAGGHSKRSWGYSVRLVCSAE